MDDKEIAKEIRAAIRDDDAERVVALIGSDTNRLNMMTVFGTWLHVASSLGRLAIVKRLVALGADVNRKGGVLGAGPLNEAASDGHIDIVRYLLSRGAELDVSDPKRNPLFGAIRGGHTSIATLLIDSGIDIHVKSSGESMRDLDALAFAREWGQNDIADYLRSKGAVDPEERLTAGASLPQNLSDEIVAYFTEHFGPVQVLALIEILPTDPSIAIHVIPASAERKYATLFTTGMSERALTTPQGKEDFRFAELFIQLPANWPLARESLTDPNFGWPIQWLRSIAKYPHHQGAWLGGPVTIIANGEPLERLTLPGTGRTTHSSRPPLSGQGRCLRSRVAM